MISYIQGKIIDHLDQSLVILAGDIGHRVYATEAALSRHNIGSDVELYTHLAVRENALDLYGFDTKDELRFFELLISVSGIGPKSGLAVLNVADVATLSSAIIQNDSSYLTKVSGIGAKSANKIVLELQGKVKEVMGDKEAANTDDMDVLEALQALGYSAHEVRDAIKTIPSEIEGANARIKEALRILGK